MCNKIARQAEEENRIAITWCISLNILIGPLVLSIVYYLRYHQAIIGYLSVLKGWETVTFFREILQKQKRHLPLRRHSIITSDLSIVKATRITLFPRHLIQEESVGSYYIHINHSIAHSKIQGTVMYLAHNGETRTGILQVKE